MDATVAFKQAALNCMAYLKKLGYTREQAHILLAAAPVESHVAAIVVSLIRARDLSGVYQLSALLFVRLIGRTQCVCHNGATDRYVRQGYQAELGGTGEEGLWAVRDPERRAEGTGPELRKAYKVLARVVKQVADRPVRLSDEIISGET